MKIKREKKAKNLNLFDEMSGSIKKAPNDYNIRAGKPSSQFQKHQQYQYMFFIAFYKELSTHKKNQQFSLRKGFMTVLKIWREITERKKNLQFFFKFFLSVN